MDAIPVWGYDMPRAWLSPGEADYLAGLPRDLPAVEWVWAEMDRVWRAHGLHNRLPLADQPVGAFYSHPVWLMNGIFTQVDPVSAGHRAAISNYLAASGARNIADFGGGFGSLALAIARAVPDARITLIEPYPSTAAVERVRQEFNVSITASMHNAGYDAVVAQDVLEHVEDPVQLAAQLAGAVREGGIVIFANCFHPLIQCHLPATFHLRHTFPLVMRALGLKHLGVVAGAEHAHAFRRSGPLSLARARTAEQASRLFGPALNLAGAVVSRMKRMAGD